MALSRAISQSDSLSSAAAGTVELLAGGPASQEAHPIFFCDQTSLHQIVSGGFERHHAVGATGLHRRGDLVGLAFADQIRHGGHVNEHFNHRDTSLSIGAGQ